MKTAFYFAFYVFISFSCLFEKVLTLRDELPNSLECENSENNVCPRSVREAMEEIETSLKCAKYPPRGMVTAVVYNRNATAVANFGYAEKGLKDRRPVDMSTKFGIGSLTKAFTATLLGMLLSEQQENFPNAWNTKVKIIMGEDFKLVNQMLTDEATLVDILAHRTGILSYDLMILFGMDASVTQREYCQKLHHLEQGGSFRSQFRYNNFMYLLASCIAEKLGNATYTQLIKNRIFTPLGMNETEFLSDARLNGLKNVSEMFYFDENNTEVTMDVGALRMVDIMEGAGGILSTGRDMCKWIKFILNGGKTDDGKQSMEDKYWNEIYNMHMIDRKRRINVERPTFPGLNTRRTFGLGWRVGFHNQFRQIEFSGEVAGFISKLSILPDVGAGVLTITNGYSELAFTQQTASHLFLLDHFIGKTPWLNSSTICSYPEPWFPAYNDSADIPAPLNYSLLLPADIPNYTGTYEHPLFGKVTVFYDAVVDEPESSTAFLKLAMGTVGEGRLEFLDRDRASVEITGIMSYIKGPRPTSLYPLIVLFRQQDPATKEFKEFVFDNVESSVQVVFQKVF